MESFHLDAIGKWDGISVHVTEGQTGAVVQLPCGCWLLFVRNGHEYEDVESLLVVVPMAVKQRIYDSGELSLFTIGQGRANTAA